MSLILLVDIKIILVSSVRMNCFVALWFQSLRQFLWRILLMDWFLEFSVPAWGYQRELAVPHHLNLVWSVLILHSIFTFTTMIHSVNNHEDAYPFFVFAFVGGLWITNLLVVPLCFEKFNSPSHLLCWNTCFNLGFLVCFSHYEWLIIFRELGQANYGGY